MSDGIKIVICSILILFVMLAFHVSTSGGPKFKYVVTSKGVAKGGYCKVGMYLSSEGANVLDENSKPITCSKELWLNDDEFKRLDPQ